MLANIRAEFMLDPDIHYLNHGSFGACPREVFDDFQDWQSLLEKNPLDYFTRQLKGMFGKQASGPLEVARDELAQFVGADSQGLIFTPNVTVALNAIAHSIKLYSGDEVLTTDHEYGTITATWARKCEQNKATLTEVPVDLPVGTKEEFLEHFWCHVSSRTKVILISHITSATALVLPVKEICARARQAGIITVVDGAHAVGQLKLNITEIDADFYTSNCHKWMLTPKGTAFLHVHATQRDSFEPMIVSWAEINQPSFSLRHEMWGTRDMAGFLCIPAALRFREKHDWWQRIDESRSILLEQRKVFSEAFKTDPICDDSWVPQIASVRLPDESDIPELWKYLWESHKIEVMLTKWREKPIIRLSYNAYNTPQEMALLLQAIQSHIDN